MTIKKLCKKKFWKEKKAAKNSKIRSENSAPESLQTAYNCSGKVKEYNYEYYFVLVFLVIVRRRE